MQILIDKFELEGERYASTFEIPIYDLSEFENALNRGNTLLALHEYKKIKSQMSDLEASNMQNLFLFKGFLQNTLTALNECQEYNPCDDFEIAINEITKIGNEKIAQMAKLAQETLKQNSEFSEKINQRFLKIL